MFKSSLVEAPSIEVRKACEGDIPYLLFMLRRFSIESALPLSFDVKSATSELLTLVNAENCIFYVETSDGVLTGCIIGTVSKEDFCHEISAYITKFYVEKEFRGLGTARSLVETFLGEAKRMNASLIFTSSTAGMGPKVEKLHTNLFVKYGFVHLGNILCKEI